MLASLFQASAERSFSTFSLRRFLVSSFCSGFGSGIINPIDFIDLAGVVLIGGDLFSVVNIRSFEEKEA